MTRRYAIVGGRFDLEPPPMRLYQKGKAPRRLGSPRPRLHRRPCRLARADGKRARPAPPCDRALPGRRGGGHRRPAPARRRGRRRGPAGGRALPHAWPWEAGKHTEFFRRFLDEVAQEPGDLHHLHGAAYRWIFEEELLPVALAIVDETFAPYEVMPFDLDLAEFMQHATDPYGKRIARIEKARTGGSLEPADEEG